MAKKNTITQRIALEGGEAVRKDLEKIGAAGKKAFDELKSASDRIGKLNAVDSGLAGVSAALNRVDLDASLVNNRFAQIGVAIGNTILIGRLFATVLGGIGAAAVGAGAGAFALAKNTAEAATALAANARELGVGTTEYQRYVEAATRAGVEVKDYVKGLGALREAHKQAVEAQGGMNVGFTFGNNLLHKFTISAIDAAGAEKTLAQEAREIIDALAKMPEGFAKAQLQAELFQKGLTPELLRATAGALDKVAESAKGVKTSLGDVGLELTPKQVEAGKNLTKEINGLTLTWERFKQQAGAPFVDLATEGVVNMDTTLKQKAPTIIGFLEGIAAAIEKAKKLRFSGETLSGLGTTPPNPVANFAKAFAAANDRIAESKGVIDRLADSWRRTREEVDKAVDGMERAGQLGETVVDVRLSQQFFTDMETVKKFFGDLGDGFRKVFIDKETPSLPWDTLQANAQFAFEQIEGFGSSAVGVITDAFTRLGETISTSLTAAWESIKSAARAAGTALHTVFIEKAGLPWETMERLANAAFEKIGGFARASADGIARIFGAESFAAIWDGFLGSARRLWASITDGFASLWAAVISGVSSAMQTVSSTVTGALNSIAAAVEAAAARIRAALASAASSAPTTSTMEGFAPPQEFARGGSVWGPGTSTSDSILARLSRGEFVIRTAAVEKIGAPFLNLINSGRFNLDGLIDMFAMPALPRFRDGGAVEAMAASGGRPVTLVLPGGQTVSGLSGSNEAIRTISRAITASQLRSAGARPSWAV